MLGPIIDSGCLLAGGLAGAYSAHLVPRRIKESLPPIFGVVTLCMGMTLVNKVASMPVVVASLLLGTLLGELVFAERLLSAAIKKILLATRRRDMPVDEGTVLSLVTLVSAFCFGSMGIFGAVTEAGHPAGQGRAGPLQRPAVRGRFRRDRGLHRPAPVRHIDVLLPVREFLRAVHGAPSARRLHRLRRRHLRGHGPADVRHTDVPGHQHVAGPPACAPVLAALAAHLRRLTQAGTHGRDGRRPMPAPCPRRPGDPPSGGIACVRQTANAYENSRHPYGCRLLLFAGAEGETRTPTPLRELDPEPSVSTNSTTSARERIYAERGSLASFFFDFWPLPEKIS